MAYRQDNDLNFFKHAENEDLDVLLKYITTGKNGATRFTEGLTMNPRYKANQPDHGKYWDLIAEEVQCFGANTFATLMRGGEGILYKEILSDVCKKLKVKYDKNSPVETIEMSLLLKVLENSLDKMSTNEFEAIVESLELKTTGLSKQAVMVALQVAIRQGGFAPYKIAVIVANAVARFIIGRGLSVVVNASLTRAISIFAGPVGWAISAVWTAVDLAGPAYRVTIPAVIQIAYMRAKMMHRLEEERGSKAVAATAEHEERFLIVQCPVCSRNNRVNESKLNVAICSVCGSGLFE